MNSSVIQGLNLTIGELRTSIREEYSVVANEPERGFHFHTGRKLAGILGYQEQWLEALPAGAIESMAGTGNPFSLGELKPGEYILDCGSGAGADVVISNGVLNLVPNKEAALLEMYRVLKPGGRIQIADIALQKPVPEGSKSDVTLWAGCIAGGLLKAQLERRALAAGFKEVEVIWGKDVFSGAPQHSDAAEFGTLGVTIRAKKAGPV